MKEYPTPELGQIWRDRDKRSLNGNRRVKILGVESDAISYVEVIGVSNHQAGRVCRSHPYRFVRAFALIPLSAGVKEGLDR